jgi:hypothetical protein
MRRSFINMSLLVATVYLSLSIASMACGFDASDRHAAGHHHGGHPAHSSFCAWACQANPVSGLVATGLPLQAVFAAVAFPFHHEVPAPFRFEHFSVSRGPPPAFLLS